MARLTRRGEIVVTAGMLVVMLAAMALAGAIEAGWGT